MNKLDLIFIDERWPTAEDTDKDGKIWVYRPASMTKWDRTGEMFKVLLETYIEPLELEIIHFTTQPYKEVEGNKYILSPQKCTKLEYTNSSRRAHNNRVQWPYWMPGHILIEPIIKDTSKKAIISSNFPVVKGHLSREEYDKITKNYYTTKILEET
jgi:hypothetical protein